MQSACLEEAGPTVVDPMAKETTLIQLIFGGYLQSKVYLFSTLAAFVHHNYLVIVPCESSF